MKNITIIALSTVLTILLFGCPMSPSQSDLDNSHWLLTDMIQNGQAIELPEKVKITAELQGNKFTGKGVCNQYNSEYSIEDNVITIGEIAATKMGCGEYANLETNYFKLLRESKSINMKKDYMKLEGENGTLKFKKIEYD